MQYIKYKLIPGQSATDDGYSTGIGTSDGYIVWKCEDDNFQFPPIDPASNRSFNFESMTNFEIEEFEILLEQLKNPPPPPAPPSVMPENYQGVDPENEIG